MNINDFLIEKFWDFLTSGSSVQLALVISIFVATLLIKGIENFFGELLGVYQLLIVSALGVFTSVGISYLRGGSLLIALSDSTSVMAYQVFIHQAIKQVKKIEYDKQSINSKTNDIHKADSINDDIDSSRLPVK